MERTEGVKRHFEEEALEYDGIIVKLIPYYSQMLEALVSLRRSSVPLISRLLISAAVRER